MDVVEKKTLNNNNNQKEGRNLNANTTSYYTTKCLP